MLKEFSSVNIMKRPASSNSDNKTNPKIVCYSDSSDEESDQPSITASATLIAPTPYQHSNLWRPWLSSPTSNHVSLHSSHQNASTSSQSTSTCGTSALPDEPPRMLTTDEEESEGEGDD